ncbi:MAG: hypothetical protein ACOYYS_00300 [Chloroflexota bacterium]
MLPLQYSIRVLRPSQKAAELSAGERYLVSPHSALKTIYRTPTPCGRKSRSIRERPNYDSFAARVKQYLRAGDDDRSNTELWWEIMGSVCARPERSIIMQVSHPDGTLVHSCVHFRYGWAVEYITDGENSRAAIFRSRKALVEHIESLWGLPYLQTPGEEGGLVDEAEFRWARAACFARDPALAARILAKAGLSETLAQRLSSALASPQINASAVCISSSPNLSLAVVGSPEGVWLLEPCQEDTGLKVKICPTDTTQVSEKLSALLWEQR